MPRSESLYVYYKLAAADRDRALAPARRVLDAGRPWCRQASLLARPELRDGIATWMEVYDGVSDLPRLEAELNAAVAAAGLAPFLSGPRRAELFHSLE
ncbi:hypothetical protein GCM10023144_29260 [Pigmentiphaga soli]|uniref:DUF4936 family protein n=1 Tax=Pigmentiphaga soli TaxID=1007095 RepID=A0ABP8H815_9BURK